MSQTWIGIGAISAFISVSAGAFGAHALSTRLEPRMLEIWETAARYQMYHALALIGLGIWLIQTPMSSGAVPGWAFTLGTLIFCGSLYALALSDIKILGAITPLGGVAFLVGWVAFALMAFKTGRA